jgi:hypothetical protein
MNATRYLPFAGRLLIGLPFAMSGLRACQESTALKCGVDGAIV